MLVDNEYHNSVMDASITLFEALSAQGKTLPRNSPRLWVLNSGGCGSTYLANLLTKNGIPRVEHEFCPTVNDIQLDLDIEGVRYFLNDASFDYMYSILYFTRSSILCECSNRLFSLAPVLKRIFPNSHFIHLVRDSRESFEKFAGLSIQEEALMNYQIIEGRRLRYVSRLSGPINSSFFEQRCWYWKNYNERIHNDIKPYEPQILHFKDLISGNVTIFEKFFNKSFEYKVLPKINESSYAKQRSKEKLIFSNWPAKQREDWLDICGDLHLKLGFTI